MQVSFLHEDAIVEAVQAALEAKLLGCNSSRTFYTQVPTKKMQFNEYSDGRVYNIANTIIPLYVLEDIINST